MKRQVANDAVQDTQPSNAAHWHSDYFAGSLAAEVGNHLTSLLSLPFFPEVGHKIIM